MFKKVLFPTDFSESALNAAMQFEKANEIEVGELMLLHVIDDETLEAMANGYSLVYEDTDREIDEIESKMREDAMRKLEAISEHYGRMLKAKKTTLLVSMGVPHDQIVRTAEEERASVILMPSHGRLGYSHEFLGSTTMRVLRKSLIPILVIPVERR